MMNLWHAWRYKNLTIFIFSIIFAYILSQIEAFQQMLLTIGDFGYIGAFIAGILYVSSFTVATGAVILLILAEKLSPIELTIIASMGSILGDLLIFRFVKDGLLEEITPLYNKLRGDHFSAVFFTKYFSWTLPLLGAVIIASPFPDELGISLMGIAKMKTYQFAIIASVLDVVEIFLIITISSLVKL